MEIRDVIHGSIGVRTHERPVLDSRYFQRLRHIKQLGFAENSFPSATHSRYIHSLGAMHIATRAFGVIAAKSPLLNSRPGLTRRIEACVRIGALLHDVGHGPLSHTTEFAMPDAKALGVPPPPGRSPAKPRHGHSRQATHEDYTLKIILDSPLTEILVRAGHGFGFGPREIAALIEPEHLGESDFFRERIDGRVVDFLPLATQLISSELDCDRMDYLRRDSRQSGVSYGEFDFDWLLSSLTSHVDAHGPSGHKLDRCFLALENRGLYAFEDFLLSRFHMFLMVYFHYKSVVYDEMLREYLRAPECDYRLPTDIDAYCDFNDAHLYAHLAKSKDGWARRISDRKPYRMLVELHSGIPATQTATLEQQRLARQIERDLKEQGCHYLMVTSESELSKYFRKPGLPIWVRYDNHYSAPSFIPLERCSSVFEKYPEKRSITRLYVSPEDYPRLKSRGRSVPLRYEEAEATTLA